jgi:hypothetical protein
MRTVCTLISVLLLVATADAGPPNLAASIPPYYPLYISPLLTQANVKAELKITKEQDKGVQTCINAMGKTMSMDGLTNSKLNGPERDAKMRPLGAKRAEELFQSLGQVLNADQMKRLKQIALQWWGIGLFDHPEIREQLRLSESQAKALRATHDKLIKDLTQKLASGKIDQQLGQKQYYALQKGVPDEVRAELTADQRAKLRDLLGKPFEF